VNGRAAKGIRRDDGQDPGVHQQLHPALEAFARAMADILVERHLERKRLKIKEHGGATVKTPGDSYRRGTDETRRNARRR